MDVEELVKQFHLLMDRSRSKTQYAYLRSTINSEEEANTFVDLFAEKTNTIWIPQTGKQISPRYAFYLTWFCNRSWRKKTTTQGDDCNAKIDIYVRKPEPSSSKYDEYLHYDPPLPCVIEIAGQHSHTLESLDYKVIKGVRDQVKREFFKYFQMGLSVIDAKNKYAMRYRKQKPFRSKHTPTLRQAQRLYNQWKGVKRWSTLQNDNQVESQHKPLTFKEILDAVPKREIMYSVKHLQSETDIPAKTDSKSKNKEFKFPLVFVTVGSVAAMPSSTAPLLYKLKHNGGEPVSDLIKPRIYSICIDSAAPVVVKGQLEEPPQKSQNPSESVSDEILGIPMPPDETPLPLDETPLPVESMLETVDIPIKLEPLDDGYNDEPSQNSTKKIEDTSMMPIITQAFSCEDTTTTEEIDIKPNICCEDTVALETDVKPNICCDKAGNSFFPLVFTLKGSIYEGYWGRSLVYDLKQGSTGVQATEVVIPQISSVQINSLNEAAFQFKDASMLKAEGPLSISVQTELLEEHSNTASSNGITNERVYEKDIIPVIVNASSCSDLFPVIAESIITWSKKPREDLEVSPVVAPMNVTVNKPVIKKRKFIKTVKNQLVTVIESQPVTVTESQPATVTESQPVTVTETQPATVTEVDKNDEDYRFLMSLLPELKRVPADEKNSIKNRIRDIFVTGRFATNRIQFEKKTTNIYRDCGVLPIYGGWKF